MGMPFHWMTVSMASRVVPATSETMERFLLARRFASEDLPTLGRPTMAMESMSSSSSASSSSGKQATMSSRRSPVP